MRTQGDCVQFGNSFHMVIAIDEHTINGPHYKLSNYEWPVPHEHVTPIRLKEGDKLRGESGLLYEVVKVDVEQGVWLRAESDRPTYRQRLNWLTFINGRFFKEEGNACPGIVPHIGSNRVSRVEVPADHKG